MTWGCSWGSKWVHHNIPEFYTGVTGIYPKISQVYGGWNAIVRSIQITSPAASMDFCLTISRWFMKSTILYHYTPHVPACFLFYCSSLAKMTSWDPNWWCDPPPKWHVPDERCSPQKRSYLDSGLTVSYMLIGCNISKAMMISWGYVMIFIMIIWYNMYMLNWLWYDNYM